MPELYRAIQFKNKRNANARFGRVRSQVNETKDRHVVKVTIYSIVQPKSDLSQLQLTTYNHFHLHLFCRHWCLDMTSSLPGRSTVLLFGPQTCILSRISLLPNFPLSRCIAQAIYTFRHVTNASSCWSFLHFPISELRILWRWKKQFDERYWEMRSGKVEGDAMGTRQSACSPWIWAPTGPIYAGKIHDLNV